MACFCPTGMEKTSKINCPSGCGSKLDLGRSILGIVDGVMALYEGSSISTYYIFER
jgi:hypothetical protein